MSGHNIERRGMNEQLYSAEEAAQILGLQVRTVRNYVREGRLPGVRIGKQYRIARSALEAFAGGGPTTIDASEPTAVSRPRATVEVSSVVQVDGIDVDHADRVIRTLTAAVVARPSGEPTLRVEPFHDEQRRRLKVIIVGSAGDTVELIRLIDALVPERA